MYACSEPTLLGITSFWQDYFGSGDTSEKKTIQLFIRDFDASNLHLIKQDKWKGEDMEVNLAGLSLDAEQLDLNRKMAIIHLLKITRPDFAIRSYNGNRPPVAADTILVVNDPLHLRWNPAEWNIVVRHALIENGSFRDDKILDTTRSIVFDSYHMHFSSIQGDFRDFHFIKDSIQGKMSLSTKEKSGLVVQKLNADVKFYPEGIEFNHFDLVTGKSHIRDFFRHAF
ncbi:MAG: hypothetical protein WDM78_03525 [Puia sp.]